MPTGSTQTEETSGLLPRLQELWQRRGGDPRQTWREGATLLASTRESGDQIAEIKALHIVAWADLARSEFAAARDGASEALRLARTHGRGSDEALSLTLLGSTLDRLGERESARQAHTDALRTSRASGDRSVEAIALNGLGRVCEGTGEYELAMEHHLRSVEIATEIRAREIEAQGLIGIGNANDNLGNYRSAIDCHRRALRIAEEIGHRQLQSYASGNIGIVHERLGDNATALSYEMISLELKQELGDQWAEGVSLNNIGIIYKNLGNYSSALEHLIRSLEISERIGDRSGEMIALHNIAEVYVSLGDRRHVLDHYHRVMTIAQEIGDRQGEAFALGHIGNFYAIVGDSRQTLLHFLKALRLHQKIGDRYGERGALVHVAKFYRDQNDFPRAEEYYGKALEIAQQTEDRAAEIAVCIGLGNNSTQQGNHDEAIEHLERGFHLARELEFADSEREIAGLLAAVYTARSDSMRSGYYTRIYQEYTRRIFNKEETFRVRQLLAGFELRKSYSQGTQVELSDEDLQAVAAAGSTPILAAIDTNDLDETLRPVPSVIAVRTFGELNVTVNGRQLRTADWGRKKARDLFKFLLLHHRRPITMETIIDRLWDGAFDRSTELVVMNSVSRIRKALEPERNARDPDSLLTSNERTYRLDLGDRVSIDFFDFKELILLARRSRSAEERHRLYSEAVDLYSDDFLKEDLDTEWTLSERELLKDAFLEAMEYLAGERLRAGEFDDAIDLSHRILDCDSTSEKGYEVLMTALGGRGRFVEIRKLYQDCREAFLGEFAVEPPARIQSLVRQLIDLPGR